MNIFVPVWGEKHINLFKTVLGCSLQWPANLAAIAGATWYLLVESQETGETIMSFVREKLDKDANAVFLVSPELKNIDADTKPIMLTGLLEVMRDSIKDQKPMLMATPDFIYGEGTIAAFKVLGAAPNSCVTIAHMRVLPEIMPFLNPKEAPSNVALINHGLNHPHDAWKYCEKSLEIGMTHIGGICWETVRDGLIAVEHYLPSPFYVNFTKEDLEFFSKENNFGFRKEFGLWDHVWPQLLLQHGRLKYVGSSDMALMLEVTDKDANVPPWNPTGKTNRDPFHRTLFHNIIQKQFIYVMRSK